MTNHTAQVLQKNWGEMTKEMGSLQQLLMHPL